MRGHNDSPSTHSSTAMTTRKHSTRQRFGLYGLFVIYGGIPLQLGVLAFLGFLWSQQQAQNDDQDNPLAWRVIVLNSWMAPTITLSTLLIRIIVGFQLVISTSLAAGLILETPAGVVFENAAKVSVLRAYNGGPWDMVWLTLQRLPRGFHFNSWEVLMLLSYLFSLGLQFSSTLLVSDLKTSTIRSDPMSQRLAVFDTSGRFLEGNGNFPWLKSPGTWSTFAEARADNRSVAEGVSDTGTIFRAFLPFEAQNRLRLLSYDGPAMTQQARTICVPADPGPSNGIWNITGTEVPSQFAATGRVTASMEPFLRGGFTFYERDLFGPFASTSLGIVDENAQMPSIPFSCPFGTLTELGRRVKGDSIETSTIICSLGDPGLDRFLLLKTTGHPKFWSAKLNSHHLRYKNTTGSWSHFVPFDRNSGVEDRNVTLSASICGLKHNHTMRTISATTRTPPTELPLSWNNHSQTWNTDSLLHLLGTSPSPLPPTSRGLLTLTSPPVPQDISRDIRTNFEAFWSDDTSRAMGEALYRGISSLTRTTHFAQPWNTSLMFCTWCDNIASVETNNGVALAHPANVVLLQAAMNATGESPALALDALWMTWSMVLYLNVVGQFDGAGEEDSTIVWATPVLVAGRWVGFVAVAGMLVGHVLLVLIIAGGFAKWTRCSFAYGLWQAVAQVAVAKEVREVLGEVTAATDGEVVRVIEEKGLEKPQTERTNSTVGNRERPQRAQSPVPPQTTEGEVNEGHSKSSTHTTRITSAMPGLI
ncbi:hypothetical protein B0T14DRAFT_499131 [Immersiella caudata]|uniref:Uncharacterized protein n=1 Tax=Immersiella caudata TaxID=314043 RepID=A0AA40BU37_9PEZI|nr:hypothetical protein B0T14DRAFT_499131 [Immersiella caudata]